MTLEQLPAAYARARTRAGFTSSHASEGWCRYCGNRWTRWHGSKLDGHSRCVVGLEFQREVCALYRSSWQISVRMICEEIDVAPSVVGSWIRNVEKVGRS